MGEETQENIDPKLKELVERFNQLAKDCEEAGYTIQPFSTLEIRISKIQKPSSILKGFRGFQAPNARKGWGKK